MDILVADDDLTTRVLLLEWLRKQGHRVVEAADGDEARRSIERHSPDVAILDWMMPNTDGFELCREIRLNPAHATMYIILATGRDGHADVVAGLRAGADDYMTKPIDTDELRARLEVAQRTLEAHAESERLLAAISSVLIGLDAEGRITRWNSHAQHTFGLSAADAIGHPLAVCGIAWAEPDRVDALIRSGRQDRRSEDWRFRNRQNQDRVVGVTITTMPGMDGHPHHVLLGADVTDRRLLETQLRQAQKLEGIGQLAAGIAHEMNTPMQYIGDNVRYLGDSLTALDPLFAAVLGLAATPPSPAEAVSAIATLRKLAEKADLEFLRQDLPSAVAQSLQGVENVSRIVKAMKEFSHPGTGEKEAVDLNRAIQTTLVVARNELKYVADVALELDVNLPPVPCMAGEVNQVLLNLFINAAHAIADVVKAAPGSRGTITVSTHAYPGEVEVRITDTGKGIPESIRSRIFEPFFTTKDVGKGTGQGLAMAHATIVVRHAGKLWFESEVGRGTTFIVRLPLQPSEVPAETSTSRDVA